LGRREWQRHLRSRRKEWRQSDFSHCDLCQAGGIHRSDSECTRHSDQQSIRDHHISSSGSKLEPKCDANPDSFRHNCSNSDSNLVGKCLSNPFGNCDPKPNLDAASMSKTNTIGSTNDCGSVTNSDRKFDRDQGVAFVEPNGFAKHLTKCDTKPVA
jgi:hypothetical protein